jgi:hypothetical protein
MMIMVALLVTAGVWAELVEVSLDDLETVVVPTTQPTTTKPVVVELPKTIPAVTTPPTAPKAKAPKWHAVSADGVPGAGNAYWKKNVPNKDRLTLMRDARTRAMGQLADALRAIEYAPGKTVGALILASKKPDVKMAEFLRGVRVMGYRLAANQPVAMCQAAVSVPGMLASFKGWAEKNAPAQDADLRLLQTYMESYKGPRLIRVIGIGVAPKSVWAYLQAKRSWPMWLDVTGRGKSVTRARQAARDALSKQLAQLPLWPGVMVQTWLADHDPEAAQIGLYCQRAIIDTPLSEADGIVTISAKIDPIELLDRILDIELATGK